MRWKPGQREVFDAELTAAQIFETTGDSERAFRRLERAHVLGQCSVWAHVLVHWRMFRFGLRQGDVREICGQLPRIVAALTKTLIWVPKGNTGGARVSAFRLMPAPPDLRRFVD